jgi:hypothetical protein
MINIRTEVRKRMEIRGISYEKYENENREDGEGYFPD